jgi:hypothetical protein
MAIVGDAVSPFLGPCLVVVMPTEFLSDRLSSIHPIGSIGQ